MRAVNIQNVTLFGKCIGGISPIYSILTLSLCKNIEIYVRMLRYTKFEANRWFDSQIERVIIIQIFWPIVGVTPEVTIFTPDLELVEIVECAKC